MTRLRDISPFHLCGALGLVSGMGLSLFVTGERGLSLTVTAAMTVSSVFTFFVVTMVRKILTGTERLTYYHHELAVLGLNALLLAALRVPVLAYLDVAVLGLGTFLAFGRLGCWRCGCCYGRPCRLGMRGAQGAGWSLYGAGVPLLPVQLMESGLVVAAIAAGVAMELWSGRPGEVFAWYTVTYGAGRFLLEFLRGDPERPYWRDVSEAQWTSWLLVTVTAIGEAVGVVPERGWHWAVAAALSLLVAALAIANSDSRAFFRPPHLGQIRSAVDTACALSAGSGEIHVADTVLGLRVSASPLEVGGEGFEVVAFSRPGCGMSAESALRIGRFIAGVRGGSQARLQPGDRGVYHLIIPFPRRTNAI